MLCCLYYTYCVAYITHFVLFILHNTHIVFRVTTKDNKLQDCFKHTNKTIHWML